MENEDQLICHNAQCNQRFCIETSALYVQLLAKLSSPAEQQSRLNAISQLQEKNGCWKVGNPDVFYKTDFPSVTRSEEHTSELQSQFHLVCRLLLEKKKET